MTDETGIDPTLLDLVRCPRCRGRLEVDAAAGTSDDGGLTCSACSLRYPVRGGVPVLLLDDAQPWAQPWDQPWDQLGEQPRDRP